MTVPDPAPAPPGPPTLSTRLRAGSAAAHQAAEHVPFLQDLLAGRLPLTAYLSLVTQHLALYDALETAVAAADGPVRDRFDDPALHRVPALRADQAALAALADTDPATVEVRPATHRYVAHLTEVAARTPDLLLAHHYVRYLGDLSGGQVIGRVLQREYALPDGLGTAFYRFTDIASPRAFKERYRATLDDLDWPPTAVDALVAEVDTAYRATTDVVRALGEPVSVTSPEG